MALSKPTDDSTMMLLMSAFRGEGSPTYTYLKRTKPVFEKASPKNLVE